MRLPTPIQNKAVLSAQTRWLGWIFSTEPASREQAEEAVRHTYRAGGVPEAEIFLWFDDLVEALLVREQLSSFRDFNSQLPPESPTSSHVRRPSFSRTRCWTSSRRFSGVNRDAFSDNGVFQSCV